MSNLKLLVRPRPASADEVSLSAYAAYQNGFVPHGSNTGYFTPVGTVTYESVAAKLLKAPSLNESRDISVDVPLNGIWVQTLHDKLMEVRVQEKIAKSTKTPQYRLDRLSAAINELEAIQDKSFAFAVLKVVNGNAFLYTSNRALAKCFNTAPALSSAEVTAISAVATAPGSRDFVAGLTGFSVATKPVPSDMISFLQAFAPAIAAQPFWTMNASGALADDVDVTGVLELHMRIVVKLKRLGATMSTRALSNVLVDAVTAIDPTIKPVHVHVASDWFAGRYPYAGSSANLALVEGVHPHLIGQTYADMTFDGVNVLKAGLPIASVVGASDWPQDQSDFYAIGRAADILSQVLVGITALLADDNNVINPSLLNQCGVSYISNRLTWASR